MAPEMQPTPESTSIAAIGHDGAAAELWVTFRESQTYVYAGVPEAVWHRLRAAESKGGFVNTVVKPRYRYRSA